MYEATFQWVGAVELASRMQAHQARHGGAEETLDAELPAAPAEELWALYVSEQVKTLHAAFWKSAGRVHELAGRLVAHRTLLEALTRDGNGDVAQAAAVRDGKAAVESDITAELEVLHEVQSSLLAQMRTELIGTT